MLVLSKANFASRAAASQSGLERSSFWPRQKWRGKTHEGREKTIFPTSRGKKLEIESSLKDIWSSDHWKSSYTAAPRPVFNSIPSFHFRSFPPPISGWRSPIEFSAEKCERSIACRNLKRWPKPEVGDVTHRKSANSATREVLGRSEEKVLVAAIFLKERI